MKKIMLNSLATTGVTLLLLAAYAALNGGTAIFISSIFQTFAVNIAVHAGLVWLQRVEWNYAALETALHIGYTIITVIAFGAVFRWFSTTPAWVLAIMAVLAYLSGLLLNIYHTREKAKAINSLLRLRDEQKRSERA